ncbi:chorismate synthase [Mycena amicta]|nr:chorismate synthase [Mycena amicta]
MARATAASVGAIIDGCPPGLQLTAQDIQIQLDRRRPGQSDLTTPRNEKDAVQLQSGIEQGVTLGTPIGLLVRNEDQRPHDYSETDFTGVKASSGGGRSSARETVGRVAAGAIAEKYLRLAHGVEIVAFVSSVGKVHLPASIPLATGEDSEDDAPEPLSPEFRDLLANVTRSEVDKHPTRSYLNLPKTHRTQRIIRAKEASDSIGGTVTCVPLLAHAMLSIPATKGFEIGSGFRGTEVPGQPTQRRVHPAARSDGGIQGGISNGEDVYFRVAFKPPATISRAQATAKYDGESGTLAARGRHDPCVVPRAVPIVEAMTAIVLMDALLIQKSRMAAASLLPPITTLPPTMVMPQKCEASEWACVGR